MTMYKIEYQKSALQALRKIPKNISVTIVRKIESLAVDPYARNNNATRLQGREGYRLRVGDWRVIYEIIDERLVIMVIDVKPRGGAYQ